MTYKKHLFLIVFNKDYKILVIQKNKFSPWELPSISVTDKSVKDSMQNFFYSEIKITNFRMEKSSSVVNRYELPKEFASVTGFSGEEQRFEFVRAESEPYAQQRYSMMWVDISQLEGLIRLKNFSSFKDKLVAEFRGIFNSENKTENEKKEQESKEFMNHMDIDRLF